MGCAVSTNITEEAAWDQKIKQDSGPNSPTDTQRSSATLSTTEEPPASQHKRGSVKSSPLECAWNNAEEEASQKRARDIIKEEEEARLKAAAEEEARLKAAAEEEEARLKAAAEEARLKAAAEEEARLKAAEEEARLKAATEEEEARLKAAEEEARLKAASEEEEARLKAAVEEEEARLKAASEEEEGARLKAAAEEEEARLKTAEEEARLKAVCEEEETRVKAAAEEARLKTNVDIVEKESKRNEEKIHLDMNKVDVEKESDGPLVISPSLKTVSSGLASRTAGLDLSMIAVKQPNAPPTRTTPDTGTQLDGPSHTTEYSNDDDILREPTVLDEELRPKVKKPVSGRLAARMSTLNGAQMIMPGMKPPPHLLKKGGMTTGSPISSSQQSPVIKRVDGDAATGEITNATMSRAVASGQKKKRSMKPRPTFTSDNCTMGSAQPLVTGISEGDENEEDEEA